MRVLVSVLLVLIMLAGASSATERITLASTTSTENSGLFSWLLPKFQAVTGIEVRVISVGTGQALRLGQNGDADILLTHARAQEEKFVSQGWGKQRLPLMYNDFVIVGPSSDPAGVSTAPTAAEAMQKIAAAALPFASRGDDSGTHAKELTLWLSADLQAGPDQSWYREMGAGMGATLNAAAAMRAYTLVDRATWLSFGNRGDLKVLVQGDPVLFNQYAVILPNPDRHPHLQIEAAGKLAEWLLGPGGQTAIEQFRLRSRQVFFPNASTDE